MARKIRCEILEEQLAYTNGKLETLCEGQHMWFNQLNNNWKHRIIRIQGGIRKKGNAI